MQIKNLRKRQRLNIFSRISIFFGFSYSIKATFYANIYALIFLAAKINPFENEKILAQIKQHNNLHFINTTFKDLFWYRLDHWIYFDEPLENKLNFLVKKVEKNFHQHKKDIDIPDLNILITFKVSNNRLQDRIFEFLANLQQNKK